jgi:hypothetical protein
MKILQQIRTINRLRIQIVLALGCVLAMACGCSTHRASVEGRRQFAVDRVEHAYIHARSPIFREWGTNLLSALSSANKATLEEPRLASATMGRDDGGEYRLYVFWLEGAPSMDSAEIGWGKTNSINLAVSAYHIADNKRASKVTLIMVASWIWSNTNGVTESFDQIQDVSSIKVRLLRKKIPSTGWSRVSFYRLDHWMGSKKITKVDGGSASGS